MRKEKSVNRRVLKAIAVLFLSVVPASAFAAPVTVSDGWFRALPANLPSGGYFTLHNGGTTPVTLTGASSPACGTLMLHVSETTNGMAAMKDVVSIPVAPGATLKFAPGGYHLMCMNPTPAMNPGATVPVTLQLAGGKTLVAPFAVKNAKGE
jgi:periplasmic copper chaperone A